MIECDCILLLNPDLPYCLTLRLKNFNLPKDGVESILTGFRITETEYMVMDEDESRTDYSKPVLSYNNYYHSSSKESPELKITFKTLFFTECGATYDGIIELINSESSSPLLYTDCRSSIFSNLCKLLCKINIRKTTVLYASD